MGKSKIFKRGPTKPSLNMTSLIDVTFQLIIFFMVVSKIVSDKMPELIPPDLSDPKTREVDVDSSLIINAVPIKYDPAERKHRNHLNFDGLVDYVDVGGHKFDMGNLDPLTDLITSRLAASEKGPDGQPKLQVILRADAAAYYEGIQPVMAAITKAKVETIHLSAYLPDKGPRSEGGNE